MSTLGLDNVNSGGLIMSTLLLDNVNSGGLIMSTPGPHVYHEKLL